MPRYFTSLFWGRLTLPICSVGQIWLRRVNVICEDFLWFTLIPHLFTQSSVSLMLAWCFTEGTAGSSYLAKIAVVAVVVLSDVGRSLVEIRCRTGPRAFPCSTTIAVSFMAVISSLNFAWNGLSVKYDSNILQCAWGRIFLSVVIYRKLVWYIGTPQNISVFFFSNVSFMIPVIQCTCLIECFCRSPNWWSGRIRLSFSIELFRRFCLSFGRGWSLYMIWLLVTVCQVSGSLWSARLSTELGSVPF
jgi:hypothetical protein